METQESKLTREQEIAAVISPRFRRNKATEIQDGGGIMYGCCRRFLYRLVHKTW